MVTSTVNDWSRLWGVSLRPWSGSSPLSLILRGLIWAVVGIGVAVLLVQVAGAGTAAGTAGEGAILRGFAVPGAILAGLFAVLGIARLGIGVFDLVSARPVTGRVVSVTDRKAGDMLPAVAQRVLAERVMGDGTGIDRRRRRTEVVLETPGGVRQWTVRSQRTAAQLHEGAHVRLTVTPIAGCVLGVEQLTGTGA